MEKSTLIRKERVLHFPGEVLVELGQNVEPSTPIAGAIYLIRRPFIVDIASPLGISPKEVREYMLKRVGDEVKTGDILAKRKAVFEIEGRSRKSPVDGVIEHISSSSGHIIIREKVEDLSPRRMNVADALGVKPKEAKRFFKKKVGELVEKGGAIAELPLMAGLSKRSCVSPIFAEIKSIDEETGEVVLQRPHNRVQVLSMLPGAVSRIIPKYGAIVELSGYYLNGVIGFGRERWGRLTTEEESLDGKVLVCRKGLSDGAIREMRERGVRGIIFGSVRAKDMEGLFSDEVYSGVTGKVDRGITVVILDGFGKRPMDNEKFSSFKSLERRYVYLNGKTQIRAGVIRPEIIISAI